MATPDFKIDNIIDQLPKTKTIPELAQKFTEGVLGVIAVLGFLAIIYSGFMYITSQGDDSKAEAAKKNLAWAVIGLILASLVWMILRLVANLSILVDSPTS